MQFAKTGRYLLCMQLRY